MSSSSEEDMYGPALPPGFKQKMKSSSNSPSNRTEENVDRTKISGSEASANCPALSAHFQNVSNTTKSAIDDDAYCPVLPPHMQNVPNTTKSESDDGAYFPALPPHMQNVSNTTKSGSDDDDYCPALPPHLENLSNTTKSGNDDDAYCPALPPHMQNKSDNTKNLKETSNSDKDKTLPYFQGELQNHGVKRRDNAEFQQSKVMKTVCDGEDPDEDEMYGPALPPHLEKKQDSYSPAKSTKRVLGPTLPSGFVPPDTPNVISKSEEDEEEIDDSGAGIGPMPSDVALSDKEYRIQQFELRAMQMKDRLLGKHDKSDKPVKRETWMLELPEDKPNFFGLGPRQFRKKTPMEKGDRSVWTDTPSDKEKKAQRDTNEGEEKEFNPESIAVKQRDDDLTARVDKYNKDKRSVPLIDLHIKKLKKKGEKSGPKERRPFSREEDLNVNKFDDAQKKSILKKAQQLNDRFSGGGKKFL